MLSNYLHFIEKEIQVQRGSVICQLGRLRAQTWCSPRHPGLLSEDCWAQPATPSKGFLSKAAGFWLRPLTPAKGCGQSPGSCQGPGITQSPGDPLLPAPVMAAVS